MEKNSRKFNLEIQEFRKKLYKEKKSIQKVENLINKKIEREPGIWEYDFDELESEIWVQYDRIEKKIKELSEEITKSKGGKLKNVFGFLKNLKGNIVIGQELIPFYLAMMLSLQKLKDRLNLLEFKVDKINREKEDLIREIQEYKSETENGEKEN